MADDVEAGVLVPWTRLSPEALRGLATEFVTRDGTDYGAVERTLEEKVAALLRQIERGEVLISFDTASETFNLRPRA